MALNVNPQYPSVTTDTYAPDGLIAGYNVAPVTSSVTLISGQNLVRGSVLGRITASGKYTLALSAAGDGSQTPVAVLAETANATADRIVSIYESGEFNANQLTFGTGHTATTIATQVALKDSNIFIKTPPLGF